MEAHPRWYQGDIIDGNLLEILLGSENESADDHGDFAVIISHDCDLGREPFFEAILCNQIAALDNQFVSAKHPRTLHLDYASTVSQQPLCLALAQDRKRRFAFSCIESKVPALKTYALESRQKRVLKQWLAARYGRPAFPDNFEQRLKTRFNARFTLERKLASILSGSSEYISAVFFEMPDEYKSEEPPEDLYVLRILLGIDSTQDIVTASEAAQFAAKEIEAAFCKVFGEPGDAHGIELEYCIAVPEAEITLTMIRRMDQWRVEYISLDNDEDSVVTSGAGGV